MGRGELGHKTRNVTDPTERESERQGPRRAFVLCKCAFESNSPQPRANLPAVSSPSLRLYVSFSNLVSLNSSNTNLSLSLSLPDTGKNLSLSAMSNSGADPCRPI